MTHSDSPVPADQILERIFSVVLEEARRRPEFAQRLIAAFPTGAVVQIESSRSKQKTKQAFDPNAFSLVAALEKEGEAGVKRRLNPIQRKQDIRAIAEAQHIPVDRKLFYSNKTRIQVLKEELVKGTKSRIADRMAAAG